MKEDKSYGDRFQDDHKPCQKGSSEMKVLITGTHEGSEFYACRIGQVGTLNDVNQIVFPDGDVYHIRHFTSVEVEEKESRTFDTGSVRHADKLMREFETGATRNLDEDKLDFEGFFSPLALEEFAKYMHTHRLQADGNLRDSDNWQKGIPLKAYMKSMYRHFFDTWKRHRGLETPEDQITNLCGLMFNAQGMLHELLKNK